MATNSTDYEADWPKARLLSTAGLRNESEKEYRATSALLAVLGAVTEFGRAFVSEFGAPKGNLTTFTEVRLKDAEGRTHVPDGALVVKRGNNKWCALVEVKTGSSVLDPAQVERYLDIARTNGFNAVITISNRISTARTENVVSVDKRKLRSVDLFHISWWRIQTMAVMQHRFCGVSDPDQAWLLGELIDYLDHERSGASGFQGMGEHWVSVRDAANDGTLRLADKGLRDIASRWDQYTEYLALSLSQELGENVLPVRRRNSTPEDRMSSAMRRLVETGCFEAGFKIPKAVGPLDVTANLRTRKVTTSVCIAAPKEGRPLTRINWLLKQLKDAPESTRVEVRFSGTRDTTSLLLVQAREDPSKLLSSADPKREPRSFEVALSLKMGQKRGIDQGSFARETRRQTAAFYRDIVQVLADWTPPAPRLKAGKSEVRSAVTDPASDDRAEPDDEVALPSTQWTSFFNRQASY